MTTQYSLFAGGGGANALNNAAYTALNTLISNGFQAGLARSEYVNTVLRQATMGSAMLGQFIHNRGFNALDDGNVANLVTAFQDAIMHLVNANVVTVPAGTVLPYAANTAPAGWLKANAAVVSQATYATLFSVIGTTFNTGGEGGGNFRLPELREEFIRGWADNRVGGTDDGRVFGSWQDSLLGSHNHRLYGDDSGSGPNGQTASLNISGVSVAGVARGGGFLNTTGGGSQLIENTGGSDTRGRNVALLYIIKY